MSHMPKATYEHDEESESEGHSDELRLLGTHMRSVQDQLPRNLRESALPAKDLENQAKCVPVRKQVTDGEGGRRYHGAFSGGFSADYHTTTGSKEGWSPQEWFSSQGECSKWPQQHTEDFMDEVDLTAARNYRSPSLLTCANFSDSRDTGEAAGAAHAGAGAHDEIATKFSTRLNAKLVETVGWQLLRQMKRRRHRRADTTTQKVYGYARCPNSEGVPSVTASLAKELDDASSCGESAYEGGVEFHAGSLSTLTDISMTNFTPKTGVHGLGYNALNGAPEFGRADATASQSTIVSSFSAQCVRQTRRVGALPISFDKVGGDYTYDTEGVSHAMQFDTSLNFEELRSGSGGEECDRVQGAGIRYGRVQTLLTADHATRSTQRTAPSTPSILVPGFVLATSPMPRQAWFHPPMVPKVFREHHVLPTPKALQPLIDRVLSELRRTRSLMRREDMCGTCELGLQSAITGQSAPVQAHQTPPLSHNSEAVAPKACARALPKVWDLVGKKDTIRLWQHLQGVGYNQAFGSNRIRPSTRTCSGNADRTLQSTSAASDGHATTAGLLISMSPPARPQPPPVPLQYSASVGSNIFQSQFGHALAPCGLPLLPSLPPRSSWSPKPNDPLMCSLRPEDERKHFEECNLNQQHNWKQTNFEAFLKDGLIPRSMSRSAGLGTAEVAAESVGSKRVTEFCNAKMHAVISERFTMGEMHPGGRNFVTGAVFPSKRASAPASNIASSGDAMKIKDAASINQETTTSETLVDAKEAARLRAFGPCTRSVCLWAPRQLLCKHFNVRPPPNALRGDNGLRKAQRFGEGTATYNDELLPDLPELVHPKPQGGQEGSTRRPAPFAAPDGDEESASQLVSPLILPLRPPLPPSNNDEAAVAEAIEKLPVDLFKAIFEDSEAEDEASVAAHGRIVTPDFHAISSSPSITSCFSNSAGLVLPANAYMSCSSTGSISASQFAGAIPICSQPDGLTSERRRSSTASEAMKIAAAMRRVAPKAGWAVISSDEIDESSEEMHGGDGDQRGLGVGILRERDMRARRKDKKLKEMRRGKVRREKMRKHDKAHKNKNAKAKRAEKDSESKASTKRRKKQ